MVPCVSYLKVLSCLGCEETRCKHELQRQIVGYSKVVSCQSQFLWLSIIHSVSNHLWWSVFWSIRYSVSQSVSPFVSSIRASLNHSVGQSTSQLILSQPAYGLKLLFIRLSTCLALVSKASRCRSRNPRFN